MGSNKRTCFGLFIDNCDQVIRLGQRRINVYRLGYLVGKCVSMKERHLVEVLKFRKMWKRGEKWGNAGAVFSTFASPVKLIMWETKKTCLSS